MCLAIVGNVLFAGDRENTGAWPDGIAVPRSCREMLGCVGPAVAQRQVEGERAALAGDADEADFAAQQHGQLAADGQAEARAAVLARRAGVGLLKRLEDEPLFLRCHADTRVLDGEGDDLLGLATARGDRCSSPTWQSRRAPPRGPET